MESLTTMTTETELAMAVKYFKEGDFLTNGKFVYKVTDAEEFDGEYLYWLKTWDGSRYGPFRYSALMGMNMRPATEDLWKKSSKPKRRKRRRRVNS